MIGRVALAVLFSLSVCAASASDSTGNYMSLSHGLSSCGTWTSEHDVNSTVAKAQNSWLMGYVTAFNRWAYNDTDITNGVDHDGLVAAVTLYCRTHPLDTVSVAAETLIGDLLVRAHPLKN